jgi:hypothetical protein
MVTEQVGLWSHVHLIGMFLSVVDHGAKLRVILWEGRGKEGQERPPWVHVKVYLSGRAKRGDIGTVGRVEMFECGETLSDLCMVV